MKLLILYHPEGEFSTMVENFVEDCKKKTTQPIELVSLETAEGASLASVYGLDDYPCAMIIREDGQLVKHWEGSTLPLFDEIMGYLNT
jgi:hypothetical protein